MLQPFELVQIQLQLALYSFLSQAIGSLLVQDLHPINQQDELYHRNEF
ncbi:unnamed protein product [Schistosoma margrebowiei]|uniref:Uncharacterized protein n=1 Tax=Schistosoma margrebowiei TaxID=48269 RepID=A0A183N9Q9_9TREM|nr:unnamed protein product [Schistosoma margrebowiei]